MAGCTRRPSGSSEVSGPPHNPLAPGPAARHAGQMSRRRAAMAAVLVLGLALASALAWRALPGLARWAVVRQIETATGRRLTIERFDLDLGAGRLAIAGLRLADRAAGPPLAE